jgi:hypothetical protein
MKLRPLVVMRRRQRMICERFWKNRLGAISHFVRTASGRTKGHLSRWWLWPWPQPPASRVWSQNGPLSCGASEHRSDRITILGPSECISDVFSWTKPFRLHYSINTSKPNRNELALRNTQSKPSPPQLYYLDHNIYIQYHDMFRL